MICPICQEEFTPRHGLQKYCLDCKEEVRRRNSRRYFKNYYYKHREEHKECNRKYYLEHREEILWSKKKYRWRKAGD